MVFAYHKITILSGNNTQYRRVRYFPNDYFVDAEGNILETSRLDAYEYGDIIIQTSNSRYIFKKVYSAYEYAILIMDYIKEHQGEDVIYIDMANLSENWDDHSGSFEVETLK